MPRAIAVIIELALLVCGLWTLSCLSTLLHEMGHALGYVLATGNGHWHIRVGSGKTLLDTRRLTVKLVPFDGCFTPLHTDAIDTDAKLIAILAGGPIASLVAVFGLSLLMLGDVPLNLGFLAPSAVESFLNSALFINVFTLVLSVIPTHYFHGEVRGMETDGLQILNAIRSRRGRW